MGCCGDLRATLPWEIDTGPPPVIQDDLPPEIGADQIDLQIGYVGRNSFNVTGAFSGRTYSFSPASRIQHVDNRDSKVLLRTRYFKRV